MLDLSCWLHVWKTLCDRGLISGCTFNKTFVLLGVTGCRGTAEAVVCWYTCGWFAYIWCAQCLFPLLHHVLIIGRDNSPNRGWTLNRVKSCPCLDWLVLDKSVFPFFHLCSFVHCLSMTSLSDSLTHIPALHANVYELEHIKISFMSHLVGVCWLDCGFGFLWLAPFTSAPLDSYSLWSKFTWAAAVGHCVKIVHLRDLVKCVRSRWRTVIKTRKCSEQGR